MTEKEYLAALERIDALMDAASGSPEQDELVSLSILVEAYEKEHYPISPPTLIGAIGYRMEKAGLWPRWIP